ncbi:MAG: hypothetical protein J6112_09665, partial [Clostridia bacterium]|nr:hypothetical protein [Clostridia bacterium]
MKLKSGDIANFIEFLDKTPTPFHVFSELTDALLQVGCERITLSDIHKAERGKAYCVTHGDSAVAAFFAGTKGPEAGAGRFLIS